MPTYPTYKLGDVADYINGRAFKPKEWKEKGLPIVRIQNLNDENAEYHYSDVMHEDKYLLHNGDLLFAWAASLGTYIWNNGDAWLNQHIFKVIPKENVSKKYLYFALTSIIKELYAKSHGSGMVHVTKDKFVNTEIPLPPLPTQQAIVARIESLFAELDKAEAHLRTAQQQLKIYKQTVLNHWLNNEDEEWEKKTAEECVVDENYSLAIGPFGSDLKVEDYTESGVKLVFVRDITSKFKDKKNKFVSEYKADQLKAHNVFKGDLLITKMGDPPGQTGIFPFDRGVITSDVLRMKTNDKILNKYYAMYYILSSEGGKQIKEMTQGVAQKKISLGRFKKFLFPVPEISEQQRIVEEIESRLSQAEAAEARIAESLQKTEALRQSILKKAFCGELV